jgi:hypothetical protein
MKSRALSRENVHEAVVESRLRSRFDVVSGVMGWLQSLFGGGSRSSATIIVETGTGHDKQALCVRIDGAYLIDLRTLPADRDRVRNAIAEVTAQVEKVPEREQIWVTSNEILELYSGSGELLGELTDQLYAATKRVSPKMIVEPDAPAGVVYVLRSLGFEVFLPGLKLAMVDPQGRTSELDVLDQLAKLRAAPRIRV